MNDSLALRLELRAICIQRYDGFKVSVFFTDRSYQAVDEQFQYLTLSGWQRG